MVLVMTPVAELYAMPLPPESEVEEILLLKVFQSVEESLPLFAAEANGRLKFSVLPVFVIVKSVPVVVVASVSAPVSVEPGIAIDEMPF